MKLIRAITATILTMLLAVGCTSNVRHEKHPGYLHALTDLRDARWNLEHRPGDPEVSAQEDLAITEIDHAISEIKKAAFEDGKNLNDHPHEDAYLDHSGRLHTALELLKKAHRDLSGEEDNPETRDLKYRSINHVDNAVTATERAINEIEHHKNY
jgi:hypothetical protein